MNMRSSSPTAEDVMNAVLWSDALDAVFLENFNNDATMAWQYFCSSLGFFRIYPGRDRRTRTTILIEHPSFSVFSTERFYKLSSPKRKYPFHW